MTGSIVKVEELGIRILFSQTLRKQEWENTGINEFINYGIVGRICA